MLLGWPSYFKDDPYLWEIVVVGLLGGLQHAACSCTTTALAAVGYYTKHAVGLLVLQA